MCLTGTYYIRFNSIESGFLITLAYTGEVRGLSRVDVLNGRHCPLYDTY